MLKEISSIGLFIILLASCSQKSTDKEVVAWIVDHAGPISTVEAGTGYEDLAAFGEMVGDARIVSLGEPTHGNREVFQLKHRLIEYLVTEEGFNIFALECPFAEAYDMNRYVLDGIGDPRKALAGIYYWAWNTEEMLALIEWLRAYNANPTNKNKVKFVGFDPQDPERATRVMLEYLARVDSELEKLVRPELGILEVPFSNPDWVGRRHYIPKEYDSASLEAIQLVMKAFDSKRIQYIEKSSNTEWSSVKQHARQAEMWIEASLNDGAKYDVVRDLGQAQNLKWILDKEGDDAKMMIWAHNSHVSNSDKQGAYLMGHYMKKWYGDSIKIVGFFFNKGQFKAMDGETPENGMRDFSIGPAQEGTLENTLAKSGYPLAVLDLDQIPKGAVRDWFDQDRRTRNSGGGYYESDIERGFLDV